VMRGLLGLFRMLVCLMRAHAPLRSCLLGDD
jgi:hypothetical protein